MDCDGKEEGDGNSDKGGGRAMAMATKGVMARATVITVVGDKEGNGGGSKSDGAGNKGCRRATAMRAIATRVAGK